jgi:hypothetical protein
MLIPMLRDILLTRGVDRPFNLRRAYGVLSHLLAQVRQHPFQSVVTKNDVMHECSGHVERSQDHEKVGQNFVHFLEAVRERFVGAPRC